MERHFSRARMARYCAQRGGCRVLAAKDYRANLLIAGGLMPVLQILEVSTFGFWSALFNAKLQGYLWKDLRLIFPHCPKAVRKRHEVSLVLNQMRVLRNRVFHHEPLLWLRPTLTEQHGLGRQAVEWIDPQLAIWLDELDTVPSLLTTAAN